MREDKERVDVCWGCFREESRYYNLENVVVSVHEVLGLSESDPDPRLLPPEGVELLAAAVADDCWSSFCRVALCLLLALLRVATSFWKVLIRCWSTSTLASCSFWIVLILVRNSWSKRNWAAFSSVIYTREWVPNERWYRCVCRQAANS